MRLPEALNKLGVDSLDHALSIIIADLSNDAANSEGVDVADLLLAGNHDLSELFHDGKQMLLSDPRGDFLDAFDGVALDIEGLVFQVSDKCGTYLFLHALLQLRPLPLLEDLRTQVGSCHVPKRGENKWAIPVILVVVLALLEFLIQELLVHLCSVCYKRYIIINQ